VLDQIWQRLVPSSDELKRGLLWYIAANYPELLECKVEKVMREKKYSILWTPAYTPELQPIEMFWAAGKNYVAEKLRLTQHARK
jgi:transposase